MYIMLMTVVANYKFGVGKKEMIYATNEYTHLTIRREFYTRQVFHQLQFATLSDRYRIE